MTAARAGVQTVASVKVERDIRAVLGDRVVSVYDVLVLDANASYDENGDNDLAFAWSCERNGTAVDVAIPSSPVVELSSGLLKSLGIGPVVFTVNVSRVDGNAFALASAMITRVNSTPPRVTVSAVVGRVNRDLKLTLQGTATVDDATTRINGTWSRVAGELYGGADLAGVARTSLASFGTSLASDLVLEPYSLVPGATYVFAFTAATATNTAGHAAVTVVVSRPPSAGVVAASPPKGEALANRRVSRVSRRSVKLSH